MGQLDKTLSLNYYQIFLRKNDLLLLIMDDVWFWQ